MKKINFKDKKNSVTSTKYRPQFPIITIINKMIKHWARGHYHIYRLETKKNTQICQSFHFLKNSNSPKNIDNNY